MGRHNPAINNEPYCISTEKLDAYLFSGALVREATMFCSIKKSMDRRNPRPIALVMEPIDSDPIGARTNILSVGM